MAAFYTQEKDGVVFLKADNIPFPHAFSTRLGGVSEVPHLKTLNLGFGRGDSEETVKENYRRFLKASLSQDDLAACAFQTQIHSSLLHYAAEGGVYREGDGFYTDRTGVILTAKVADCVPILLADPEKRLIAALHAGWRGTVAGIAEKGVAALCSLGARPERIQAAIGPSIGACCYEVGEDFVRAVREAKGDAFAEAHITVRTGQSPKAQLFADVAGMNRTLLLGCGLKAAHIAAAARCTACESELFFSHRASGGRRGTMAAVIHIPCDVRG